MNAKFFDLQQYKMTALLSVGNVVLIILLENYPYFARIWTEYYVKSSENKFSP